MKVIKELPLFILWYIRLSSIPAVKLRKQRSDVVPVVVSLTSIPSRLKTLHLVIRCLMVQKVAPMKIVLWLESGLEGKLPEQLKKLEGERFEIRFSAHCISSHSKLIHSLEAFPDNPIVTCDDDYLYSPSWLSLLFSEHLKHPGCIIARHSLHINHDQDGNPLPFKQWNYPDHGKINPEAVYPLGAWGVLYPPGCLSERATDREAYMKLAPKADDHWFKAMSLLKGTRSVQVPVEAKEPIPVINTQKIALKKINLGEDRNTDQWRALEEQFGLSGIILGPGPEPGG